jgi:hypothetical protein
MCFDLRRRDLPAVPFSGSFRRSPLASILSTPSALTGGHVTTQKDDDWTIKRWKTEPRLVGLEFNDATEAAPPLWKDLTLASAVAILLWAAAVVIFR